METHEIWTFEARVGNGAAIMSPVRVQAVAVLSRNMVERRLYFFREVLYGLCGRSVEVAPTVIEFIQRFGNSVKFGATTCSGSLHFQPQDSNSRKN